MRWLDSLESDARKRWSPLLIVVGLSTTIGLSLPVGYNIGVVNSPAAIIKTFCNESVYARYNRALTIGELQLLWSGIVSIFLVGGTIGSLTGSWFADRLGRKGAIVVSTTLSLISGILFLIAKSSNSVETLILGRLLIGLAAGLITCSVPMYLTELAPVDLRGAMGAFCPLGINCGVLISQILSLKQLLGTEEYWPHLLSAYTVVVVIFAATITILPESPKYLLFIRKHPHEAIRQLERIRGMPKIRLEDEMRDIKAHVETVGDGSSENWNILKTLRDPALLLPILLVCSMQAGQQFSGINAVFYYSASIFEAAGLSEMNGQLATIGAGIINLGMACASIPIMSRFGRRSVMQISCFLVVLSLLLLTLSITYITTSSWMPYICIAAVLSYVLCYGIGLGPVPYFIGAELFEVGPRPSAMALGSMANWGGNFFIGLCFPAMQDSIGARSFLIFASVTLALFIFLRWYLPETKGRDPSEVYNLCGNGFRSRVSESPVYSTTTAEIFLPSV